MRSSRIFVPAELLADPVTRLEALRASAVDEGCTEAICMLLGLEIGKLQPTPLPSGAVDYTREGRVARVERDNKNRFCLRHLDSNGVQLRGEKWLLPEVYAAMISKRTRHLSKQELPRWTIRSLKDIGATKLPELDLGMRPMVGVHTDTWSALLTFWSIRRLTDGDDPFPLSRSFLRDWCNLASLEDAKKLLAILTRSYLVAVGVDGPLGRENPSYLYRLRIDVPEEQIVDLGELLTTKQFSAAREAWFAAKKETAPAGVVE